MKRYELHINGQSVKPSTDTWFETRLITGKAGKAQERAGSN